MCGRGDDTVKTMASSVDRARFLAEGYLVVRDLIQQPELELLRAQYETLVPLPPVPTYHASKSTRGRGRRIGSSPHRRQERSALPSSLEPQPSSPPARRHCNRAFNGIDRVCVHYFTRSRLQVVIFVVTPAAACRQSSVFSASQPN